jgi:hypothetical protein
VNPDSKHALLQDHVAVAAWLAAIPAAVFWLSGMPCLKVVATRPVALS